MNTISQDDDLVKMIKLLLKGKEAHPRYQKWFDDFMTLEQRHLKNFVPLLNEFTPLKDKLIFDFGCGTGRILAYLEERVARAVGVDPAETMVQVARQRVRRAELVVADITRNDVLSGDMFDVITAFRIFLILVLRKWMT